MPTTAGGIVYPSASDVPDVPADLETLADSIEAGLAWVTTGFTPATGFTAGSFRYKRIGAIVFLNATVTKATSAITVAAGSGDIANVVIGTMPAGLWPSQPQPLGNGTLGRVVAGFIDTSGQLSIQSVAGDGTNIAVGNDVSLGGCYVLG